MIVLCEINCFSLSAQATGTKTDNQFEAIKKNLPYNYIFSDGSNYLDDNDVYLEDNNDVHADDVYLEEDIDEYAGLDKKIELIQTILAYIQAVERIINAFRSSCSFYKFFE